MGQRNRQRHVFGGLIRRIPEHHPLVASSADIHAHRDIRRLLVDRGHDAAGFAVKTIFCPGIPDLDDRIANDAVDVDIAIGRDLSDHMHQAGRHHRLTGDPSHRILL